MRSVTLPAWPVRPKFGDAGASAGRISQGFDTLVKHAVEGIRGMPAKGGATDLTNEEVARAVAFMANAGGAKFAEPKVKARQCKVDPAKGKGILPTPFARLATPLAQPAHRSLATRPPRRRASARVWMIWCIRHQGPERHAAQGWLLAAMQSFRLCRGDTWSTRPSNPLLSA